METVTVVNMIPWSLSGETNQDSEPNLAVNPNNPTEIAATAFTPNPDGSSADSPIFYSSDGGNTWTLLAIIAGTPMRDQTVRFSGRGNLYAGVLWGSGDYPAINFDILRTSDFSGLTEMTLLERRQNDDQPFVQAATVPAFGPDAGEDRVYVASTDHDPTFSRPSTIDYSKNAAAAAPVFTTLRIGNNTFPTRSAVHSDGTVYAVFNTWGSSSLDVMIVRDDLWGGAMYPFTALGNQGIRIATGGTTGLPSSIGQQRIVGGDLSIAVHPYHSERVYVCWGGMEGTTYTLHIQGSLDGGKSWSGNLRTVENATNPALAFNDSGVLGFLYQQVTGTAPNQRWQTAIERTSTDFKVKSTRVLADTPATAAPWLFSPYLGDYIYLMAVGDSFYGVFCADNTPDVGNFPSGVTYQRAADFPTKTLSDLTGNAVPISIDPFFFSIRPDKPLKFEVKEIKDTDKVWSHDKPPQIDMPQKLLQPLETRFVEKPEENWQQYGWNVIRQIAARVDSLEQRLATARVFIEPDERPQVHASAAQREAAAPTGKYARKERKGRKKKGRKSG